MHRAVQPVFNAMSLAGPACWLRSVLGGGGVGMTPGGVAVCSWRPIGPSPLLSLRRQRWPWQPPLLFPQNHQKCAWPWNIAIYCLYFFASEALTFHNRQRRCSCRHSIRPCTEGTGPSRIPRAVRTAAIPDLRWAPAHDGRGRCAAPVPQASTHSTHGYVLHWSRSRPPAAGALDPRASFSGRIASLLHGLTSPPGPGPPGSIVAVACRRESVAAAACGRTSRRTCD